MTSHPNKITSPTQLPKTGSQESLDLDQRLLAETVRLHEETRGLPLEEPQADAAARAAGGDEEQRLVVRAESLSIAPAAKTALQQLRGALGLAFALGLVLATVAGATTAQVALGSAIEEPINFFWVLGSLLGVHLIALLLWLVFMTINPGALWTGSLGGLIFALGRKFNRWLHKGGIQAAAVQAVGSVYGGSPLGRWTLSAVSHALWLAFLSGCLVMVLIVLSIKQYSFAWETTILSKGSYVALTRALAGIPDMLGFLTPDAQQIAASRWTGQHEPLLDTREAWSGLLIGSLVAYGLLPRALLLIASLGMRQRAATRFRLDTTHPGFSRLRSRLMPATASLGVVDPATLPAARAEEPVAPPRPGVGQGPPVILGLEIDMPGSGWPPSIGIDWHDLGLIDTREERRRILEQIRSASVSPRSIVAVCSLTTTPDRGIRAFIEDLQQAAPTSVTMVLTEGQRLRTRGHPDEIEQRVADWRRLAAEAQLADDRIIEVDLDHLTDVSRARLARLIGAKPAAAPSPRRLAQSFAVIVDHVERWSSEPSAGQQADMHRAIAALYRHEQPTWQNLLRARIKPGIDPLQQLRTSADRMVDLLPARLRRRPRWLAAGALAGAMGCVAAATLITPVAVAALPAWAGLGAALAAIMPNKQPDRSDAVESLPLDLGEAVAGAALFAVLLELQGRSETAITRIVDQIAAEEDPPFIDSPAAARDWLDTLQERFERALAVEGPV